MGCDKLLHCGVAEKKSCKIAKTIANSRIMQRIALVIFLLCGASLATAQKENLPYVLLVSMDGFTNQYIHRYELPNLKKFIKEGAAAEGLIPWTAGRPVHPASRFSEDFGAGILLSALA